MSNNLVPVITSPTCLFAVEAGITDLSLVRRAGGTLGNGPHYWVVTAIDRNNGESARSNEVSFVAGGGYNSVDLTWTAIPGANGHNIYRTEVSGLYGAYSLVGGTGAAYYYLLL